MAKLRGMKFWFLMVGLMLSIFISSLDNTIVSTSLAAIASEFNSLNQVTWVVVSYMVTSTAMQPLLGKLSDIFGRKLTILFALLCFLVGSAFCGMSTNIVMLIVSRAVSGIGGGGLYSLSVIIISDIVPMKERSIYMGMANSVFAIASIAGPLVGGTFTDVLTWRWAFYINIPICLATIIAVSLFLDLPKPDGNLREKLNRIDFLGAFLLITSVICLVLGLGWGGNQYKWGDCQVILPLCLGLVVSFLFVVHEIKTKKEPIIPMAIFNQNTIAANIISFFHGALGMTLIYYLPIYYQVVKGESSTLAGLELLPMLLASVACTILIGAITTRTGVYCPYTRLGSAGVLIGIVLLGALFHPFITKYEEIGCTLLIGIGIGFCFQNNTIISQAASKEEEIAVVTSLIFFTDILGAVIGVAIQGAIFINSLKSTLPILNHQQVTSSVKAISSLSIGDQILVKNAYMYALQVMFLSMAPYAALPFIASLFLKHIPLQGYSNISDLGIAINL